MFQKLSNFQKFRIFKFLNFKISKSILKSAVLPASLMPFIYLPHTGCLVQDLNPWRQRRCQSWRQFHSCWQLQLRRGSSWCLLLRRNSRLSKWRRYSARGSAFRSTQQAEGEAGSAQQHQNKWRDLGVRLVQKVWRWLWARIPLWQSGGELQQWVVGEWIVR